MLRRLVFLFVLNLVMPMHVLACGPSPKKVVVQVIVDATPDAVWQLVGDIANMQVWHPNVKATEVRTVQDQEGVETVYRTLTLQDGGQLVERMRPKQSGKMKIGVVIEEGSMAVSNYSDALTVKPGLVEGTSVVTWTGRFNNKANLLVAPKGQDNEAAVSAVNQFYDLGLNGLKHLIEASSLESLKN
jgi:hypothetical protein